MNKERAKEILTKFKTNRDLFNWCEEYKSYMDNNVYCLVNEEAEYMIKKSFDDSDSPLSYEDIEESINWESINTDLEEGFIDDEEKTEEEKKKLKIELDKLISEEDISEVENWAIDNLLSFESSDYYEQREIMQWFIVSSNLAHSIKEHDGVILNENWFGRESYGQSLNMDWMFIEIYTDNLKNWFDEEELKQFEKD